MAERNSSFIQLGFLTSLTLVFVTLKLLHKIDWSWWWVVSPLWLPYVVIVVMAAIILFGMWVAEKTL